MKTAVMYGAGKIGRGFVGKVFSDSGYEVCFLDIKRDLVDELNARKQYTVRLVDNEGTREETVRNVYAAYSLADQAIDEIARCEVMATAVGANELKNIAPIIARAAVRRMERGGKPLNVIICENQLGADELLHGWIYEALTSEQRAWADDNLGLVQASVDRMVPPMTPEMLAEDALLIRTEPFCELPVNRDAFRGEIPALKVMEPCGNFEFYIKRKLFVHNGGHALCAYLGYEKGYEYIWQAIADSQIYEAAKASMLTSARSLAVKFGEERYQALSDHVDSLLVRFQNRALMDTVTRVGADPVRKLRRNDRIVGAALFAIEQGVDPAPIVRGILAALKFNFSGDATAPKVQAALAQHGIDHVLEQYMQLAPDEALYGMIRSAYIG